MRDALCSDRTVRREMAVYRAPVHDRWRRQPPSPSARRAMELAALALTDAVPPLLGDAALVERERFRQQTERKDSAQRQLDEGGTPWA